MEKVIIARYGEIGIKSPWVRMEFEKQLADNISRAIIENNIGLEKIRQKGARTYVWCSNIPKALKVLKNVFGIVSYSPAQVIETDFEKIKKTSLALFKKSKKKKFRVTTRRVFKKFPMNSMDVSAKIGEYILGKTSAKVSLKKYDVNIGLEITKHKTFVFAESFRGHGGLPIGVEGKAVCLIENKNSFFNAWLMAKRGCELVLVLKNKALEKQAKKFEKKYYYFKRELHFEMLGKDDDFVEKTLDVAKREGAKAIAVDSKNLGVFEKATDIPIFYPSMGYSGKCVFKI